MKEKHKRKEIRLSNTEYFVSLFWKVYENHMLLTVVSKCLHFGPSLELLDPAEKTLQV